MNTLNNSTISFGQLVPTKALLKTATTTHEYNDSKELYTSITTKFPGHVGYYKQASIFAKNIIEKNPKIKEIVDRLSELNRKQKIEEINRIVSELGETIDVEI